MFFAQKRGKLFGVPTGAHPLPWMGHDAPTTARKVGLLPRGGQYFLSKRKKVPKKASGTATTKTAHVAARRGLRPAVAPSGLSSSTGCPVSHSSLPVALLASHPPCGSLWAAPKAPLGPRFPSGQFAALTRREKALYCPFLKEGVRNVARSTLGLPTWTFVRARAHSNPLSKRARLFPSAAYRRSAPPQSAAGILIPCGLGRLPWLGGFAASRNEGAAPLRSWFKRFGMRKASVVSKPCWPLLRAMRPVAEWR